jgi:cytochrome c oxidase assembly protein subunit 15
LLSYTFWFALQLRVAPQQRLQHKTLRNAVWLMLAVLVVQLIYGALMAGHKAATAAATWPTINGYWLQPPGLYNGEHGWLNFIDNKIMVHFIHRGLAYLLVILVGLFFVQARNQYGMVRRNAWIPFVIVLCQVALGVLSVLSSKGIVPNEWGLFEWMAQLHQLTGMLLLLSLVLMLYLTTGGKKAALAA